MSWPKIVNARGQSPAPSTTPADKERCQAFPNLLSWTPMSFGPMPEPIRCDAPPVCIAVENRNESGKGIGLMSLCASCLELFKKLMPTKSVTIVMKKGS